MNSLKVGLRDYLITSNEKVIYVTFIITFVTNMITIIKKGYTEIMRLFYKDKTAKFHLREISRKTRLHEPSVTKLLRDLETEGVLKSEKKGNLKNYSIKKSVKTYFIFEAFDIERLEKLPLNRLNAIKLFLDNLEEKPVFAVVFGSTAKENYKETSDIDILLITNSKINSKSAEKEVDSLTATKINVFQMTYKDFLIELKMKEDKVVQSAINSGYPLMNFIQYHGVTLNERI